MDFETHPHALTLEFLESIDVECIFLFHHNARILEVVVEKN